jgi:hypothetical protein
VLFPDAHRILWGSMAHFGANPCRRESATFHNAFVQRKLRRLPYGALWACPQLKEHHDGHNLPKKADRSRVAVEGECTGDFGPIRHPLTLYLWRARLPLTACQAVLFPSLEKEPEDDQIHVTNKENKGNVSEGMATIVNRAMLQDRSRLDGPAITRHRHFIRG